MSLFHSIRWRLILSYALLTLLTISVVGFLTLSLMQRYLDAQESDYLTANADAIARQAQPFLEVEPVQNSHVNLALTQLIQTAAFLGNVQVRLLDSAGQVLVDSGPPESQNGLAWILSPSITTANGLAEHTINLDANSRQEEYRSFRDEDSLTAPFFAMPIYDFERMPVTVPFVDNERIGRTGQRRWITEHTFLQWSTGETGSGQIVIVRTVPSRWGPRFEFEEEARAIGEIDSDLDRNYSSQRSAEPEMAPEPLPDAMDSGRESMTMGGSAHVQTDIVRSPLVVTVAIGGEENPLGFVELSNGPDLGAESLATIQQAFLWAAGGASLLAVVVGLLVGQGLTAPLRSLAGVAGRMGRGDMSARSAINSRDEIGLLSQQFNQMAERLETSFATVATERDTLRRFMADASHELRTPVTALKTFNTLLQGQAATDPAAQVEFLAESQRQIERLEWITANLLDLSRLDAGLLDLDLQPHDVQEILDAVVTPFQLQAQENEIRLVVKKPITPITLVCDRDRLELALSNLVENGLKFTIAARSQSSRSLTDESLPVASTQEATIVLGAEQKDNELAIWCEDNGPGIAKADLPHVFERFYRSSIPNSLTDTGISTWNHDSLSATLSDSNKQRQNSVARRNKTTNGSGLGLAIVQSVAQAYRYN